MDQPRAMSEGARSYYRFLKEYISNEEADKFRKQYSTSSSPENIVANGQVLGYLNFIKAVATMSNLIDSCHQYEGNAVRVKLKGITFFISLDKCEWDKDLDFPIGGDE